MYECMSNSNSLCVYAGFALIHHLILTDKTHTLKCMKKKQLFIFILSVLILVIFNKVFLPIPLSPVKIYNPFEEKENVQFERISLNLNLLDNDSNLIVSVKYRPFEIKFGLF